MWVGLAGGAVLLWMYLKKKNAASATGPTTTLPAMQPTTANASNPTQLLPVASTTPVTTTAQVLDVTPAAPNGIDPTVYATVSNWVVEDGNKPPKVAMQQAAVPAEFNGMYDLIINWWDKGVPVPYGSPEQQFWDALRTKYDPTHIYW